MRHVATKIVIFLSVLTVMSVLTHQTTANLLVNGGFDTPDVTGCFTTLTSSPPGFSWTITPDGGLGADLIDGFEPGRRPCWDGIGGTTNPDGIDQSVDIDGATSIAQSFATVAGQTYELSLFYSRNPTFTSVPRTGFVRVTGSSTAISATLVHDVPNSTADMNWLQFSDTFIADSAMTTLTIRGAAVNGREGFAVDNVLIEAEHISEFAPCDFNNDRVCDVVDIDQMFAVGDLTIGVAVTPTNASFDLNQDNSINSIDAALWLADAAADNGFIAPYHAC